MYLHTSHHKENKWAMGEPEVERIDESGNVWDPAMYLHTSHHKGNIKAVMGESEVERICRWKQ